MDLFSLPEPADDVYFSLETDEAVTAAVDGVAAARGFAGRRPGTTYHISLLRLGALPGLRKDDLAAAADAANCISCESFTIELQRLQSWKRAGPQSAIVLLCRAEDDAAVQWLAASLGMAVGRSGVRTDGIPPRPHLTVAYDPTTVAAVTLPKPIVMTATQVHLVRNRRGEGRREELACYDLR